MMGLWHEAKHPVKFWSNLKTPKFWAFLESEILCSKIFKFFFEIFRINNIFLDNFFLFQKFFKIFKILNFFFKKHQKWNARDFNFFKFSIPVTWGFQNGMACSCAIFCDLILLLKHCAKSAIDGIQNLPYMSHKSCLLRVHKIGDWWYTKSAFSATQTQCFD